MIPFLALRALGWSPPSRVVEVPAIRARLSDPINDAITHGLVLAKLWHIDLGVSLTRDGRRVSVRVMLPEAAQGDRHVDRKTAEEIRHNVIATLAMERHTIKFHDVLFCERGRKGWEVVIRAEERA